ncbi:MAG: hypothetical protein Q4G42_01850 [Neisseria sp.]|nr:hypothetical protein [Neisseria sp.]
MPKPLRQESAISAGRLRMILNPSPTLLSGIMTEVLSIISLMVKRSFCLQIIVSPIKNLVLGCASWLYRGD